MRLTSIYSDNTELGVTTINPGKLNCRVRNGNGCGLTGINICLIPTPLFSYLPLTFPVTGRTNPTLVRTKIIRFRLKTKFSLEHINCVDIFGIKEYGQASRSISTG